MALVSYGGTFTSQTAGPSFEMGGSFVVQLSDFTAGTVELQRYDGSAWVTVASYASTDAVSGDIIKRVDEPEAGGVLYRWNCTSYSSGTIVWKMSR